VGDHARLEGRDRTAIGERRADVFTDVYKVHLGILPEFASHGLSQRPDRCCDPQIAPLGHHRRPVDVVTLASAPAIRAGTAKIYEPPYPAGPRPRITACPSSARYNSDLLWPRQTLPLSQP
jgi:hypothetical protein